MEENNNPLKRQHSLPLNSDYTPVLDSYDNKKLCTFKDADPNDLLVKVGNEVILVKKEQAVQCDVLKCFVDYRSIEEDPLNLDVDLFAFYKLQEFLRYHENIDMTEIQKPLKLDENDFIHALRWEETERNVWDVAFITNLQQSNPGLFRMVIQAAKFLSCQSFVDLSCARLAFLTITDDTEKFKQSLGIQTKLSRKEVCEFQEKMPWSGKLVFPITVSKKLGGVL